MLLRCNTELIVECVVPDLLHVVPVGHDSVLNRVLQVEDTSHGFGVSPHIGVLCYITGQQSGKWILIRVGFGSNDLIEC